MKLFCRHCWSKVIPWIGKNAEHIEARCETCGGWIKFLSGQEARELLVISLRTTTTPKPTPRKQRQDRPRYRQEQTPNPIILRKPAMIRTRPS